MPAEPVQVPASGILKRVLIGRDPARTLARIVILITVSLILYHFVAVPTRVHGISMMPTYSEGRLNVINRLAYVFHEPRRGDTVAIKLAGEHVMYLKRIIALPGETLEFRAGHAYINGQRLEEPYVQFPCTWEHPAEKIGSGEYYVVGDNRSMDFSEHYQGKAWRSQIVGKTLL